MADLKERILQILKRMQLAGFATVTADGKPWVRYVMAIGDDDMEMRFASFAGARKVAQIAENPEVHLTCGVTDPRERAPYLQIQGRARFTTEEADRHAFWTDMLKGIFSGPDDPNYGVVIVEPYRIEYWDMSKHEPDVWEAGS